MEISTTRTNLAYERETRRSLIGGIALWFVHQNVVYALTSLSCAWSWLNTFWLGGLRGFQVVQIVITLVALALMALLIYLPYRSWRQYQTREPIHNPDVLEQTEEKRPPLVGFVVMGVNAFFLLFMIATFVPVLTLRACAGG